MKQKQPEPEHYSWSLGTPDNGVGTEVIVNPYGNQPARQEYHPQDLSQDYPEHINPYQYTFSANIDGDEVLLPTVSPEGKDMDEDEIFERFRKTGKSLGRFDSVRDANDFARQKAPIELPAFDISAMDGRR